LRESRLKVSDRILYPVGRWNLIARSEARPVIGDDLGAGAFGKFGEQAVPVAGVSASASIQNQGRQTAGQDMEGQMVTVNHYVTGRKGRRCLR